MGFNYMTFCILDRIISCMNYVGLRNDSTVKIKIGSSDEAQVNG